MVLATALGCILGAQTSSAITIQNVTINDLPSYVTAVGGNTVAYAPSSHGDTQVFNWLQGQVNNQAANEILARGDTRSFSLQGSWINHYLVVHWGAGQANQLFNSGDRPTGGFSQVFKILGQPGDTLTTTTAITLSVPQLKVGNTTKNVGGLSYWRVYDPPPSQRVPDAGSTAGLMGCALGLLALIKSRFGRH
jgi:hypothetical protein